MKNRNNLITAVLFVIALALAPIAQAVPQPGGGPTYPPTTGTNPGPTYAPANEALQSDSGPARIPEGENLPVITIHSTDNVTRGKIGSFVLDMKPRVLLGGMYVNFSVSGTAVQGVDYVPLVSPAYIGQSGYGVIQIQTLPDPRESAHRQAYSVVVTLEPGAGYALGIPSSATMWIKP
jgi:hypothetical protein